MFNERFPLPDLSRKIEGDSIRRVSRAETYDGSPSPYFCDYTNTATCYNCLSWRGPGRQSCEIMGSKNWHTTSVSEKKGKRTSKKKFKHERSFFELYSALCSLEHNKRKARALIGQLAIYYLPIWCTPKKS